MLFRAVETVLAALGGRAFYRRRFLAHGRFRVRAERVVVPGLPRALDGWKIAQLSDIHAGTFLARGDLADVVASINAAAPDIVTLTGDYITHGWSEALTVLPDLARLRARHGVCAVFGNHDYRGRNEQQIADAFEREGIRFLRNDAALLNVEDARVAVVGIEDLEEAREIDLARARRHVQHGDVEIALCHNPRGAAALARDQCAVVLSGHTHAGQVDLPGLRSLGPAHPGLRMDFG